MPGPQLQTIVFLLDRSPTGADAFEAWTAGSAEHGLLHCLRRRPRPAEAAAAPPLDLFDEAELWLESSNQGRTWFIREHRLITRFPGIGRSYEALCTAARLARLLTRNPLSDDSRGPVALLLRQTFTALDQAARPDLVWLKSLFCLLRDEGYPVKQQWWTQLPGADRSAAALILNQPLAGQAPDPGTVARLIARLEQWAGGETELQLGSDRH